MNKNILLLCGLFLLTACGGGSGSGGGSNANIRQPVVNNNAKVTSLNTTVDNRAETIAFVEGLLGETYYILDADGSVRPSPRGGTNRASSYTSDAYNKYIQRYRNADLKIRDMHDLLSMSRTDLDELLKSNTKAATRLKDSLLLAGKTIPENATNEQLLDLADTVSALEARAILDAYALKTVKLDEVSLLKAESSQSNKKSYKFKIDDKGQIVGITRVDGSYDMARVGDSSVFTARIDNGAAGYTDEELTIQSYGKKVGLSYTDFGNLFTKTREHDANGNVTGNSQTSDAFAGGYEYKKIADTAIAANMKVDTEMNFKGRAVGTVENNSTDDRLLVDGSATLNFKQTGEQTLKANFSEGSATGSTAWYDTVLTKNANGTYDIAFDNTKNVTIDDKFKGAQNINSNTNNMAEINYYGDAGNASEASGIIHYTEGDVELKSAFGVKKVD